MARKPIAPGHDPRRRVRAPSEIEAARYRLRERGQRRYDEDEPAAGSGYGRDGGQVISLSQAASALGAAYPQLSSTMATLAALGGTNPLTGIDGSEQQYPDMAKINDTRPPKGMLASTGTPNYAGIINDPAEYNSDFYWRHGVRIYDEMVRSDPQVRLMLQLYQQPIRSAVPTVVPGSDDPADVEIASFVETCLLEGMTYEMPNGGGTVTTTWDDVLRHALSMHQYGFSLFELCYTINDDGYVVWTRWLPMLARTVWRWWINEENDLVGVQQYAFRDYKFQFVNVPVGKLLRFTHAQEGSNYDGIPILRSAYVPWFFKQQFQRIEAVAIERMSIIPAVMSLPPGAPSDDYGKAAQIVQNLRANERMGVVIPATWHLTGMEGLQQHGRGGIQLQETLQYYDIQIARAFAAQFVNLGSTENGARSLDMSQKRTFLQMLQAECQYLEDVINTMAIKRLVDYNYAGVEVYPRLKFPNLMAGEIDSIAAAIQQLASVGFLTATPETEDMLRKALALPDVPRSEIETSNPAGPDDGSQDEQGGSEGGDGAGGGRPNTDNGDGGQGNETPDNGAYDDGSDGGSGMSERDLLIGEARLLREALDAAYGRDAVAAGIEHSTTVQLMGGHEPGYQQARGAHGQWGVTTGPYVPHPRQPGEKQQTGHEGAGRTGHRGTGGGGGGGSEGTGGTRQPKAPRESAQERQAVRVRASARAKGKAEAEGEAGKAGATRRAAGGGAKAKGEPKEDLSAIHERAARLQREGNLPRESQPGEKLDHVGRGQGVENWDPYGVHSARELAGRFGEHQLGNALNKSTMVNVKRMAKEEGVSAAGTKAELVSRITAKVTNGRYSANFEQGAAKRAAGGAPAKATMGEKSPEEVARAEAAKAQAKALKSAEAKVARAAQKEATARTVAKTMRDRYNEAWNNWNIAADNHIKGIINSTRFREAEDALKAARSSLLRAQSNYGKASDAHRSATAAAIEAGSKKVTADPRESIHEDASGQQTPFSRADFEHGLEMTRPVGGEEPGVNASHSGFAKLGGREYYVKQVLSGTRGQVETPEREAVKEVAARQLAVAAGHGEQMPAEVYHFEHNGEHYVVSSKEAAKPLADRGFDLSPARAKAFDAAMANGRGADHLMTDYVLDRNDGHSMNYLFDAKSGALTHIDYGRDLSGNHDLDHWGENAIRESMARQTGMTQSRIDQLKEDHNFAGAKNWTRNVAIPHEVIRSFTGRADAIQSALARSGLSEVEQQGVINRLNVLRELDNVREPTLWHWHRLSEGKSIPTADLANE